VVRALEEYLAAPETGPAPERAPFLARHAEVAGALAECLDGLEFIRAAAARVRDSSSESPPSPSANSLIQAEVPLGDYRIVREVGRGGMGVVYEAVQLSLGRRVALKVLPFAAALDARQLQRFKNEAQAAAQLHHTNIVPVYGVGCERGVHYYSMQFIEGQTLAAVIAELHAEARQDRDGGATMPRLLSDAARALLTGPGLPDAQPEAEGRLPAPGVSPPPGDTPARSTGTRAGLSTERSTRSPAYLRSVAQLGVQAAEALEHAHQLGIVHRDIKPANLLMDYPPVTSQHSPRLWITDFGLAHCQSQAGLTMSGDLLGTLRYMSPEQALAQRLNIDHRTDIYSLGATLYECLTLEPAFPGVDRQELLRQIAFEEPKPPRQVNPAIPGELETIVLKALEKSPADRYATAKDLADDLGRYLRDEPIRARRPTLWQRGLKWFRRHKTIAAILACASGAVLLVLAISATVAAVKISHACDEANAAAEHERQAREKAQKTLDLTLRALNRVYLRVAETRFPREPQRARVDAELLKQIIQFYQELVEHNPTDFEARQNAVNAWRRVGRIHQRLGQLGEAENAIRQGIVLADKMAADFPGQTLGLADRSACYLELGYLLINFAGRPQEAERAYRRSLALAHEGAGRFSNHLTFRQLIAYDYSTLGHALYVMGQYAESEKAQRQGLALWEELADTEPIYQATYRMGMASGYNDLADVLQAEGRLLEAEQGYRRALEIAVKLVAQFPHRTDFTLPRPADESANSSTADANKHNLDEAQQYHSRLAAIQNNLAKLLQNTGRRREAEESYRRALRVQELLAAAFPSVPDHQRLLALIYANLGTLLWHADRAEGAKAAFRRSLEIQEKLVTNFRSIPGYLFTLAGMLADCPDPGFRNPARAVALAKTAVELVPEFAPCWKSLGIASYRSGDDPAAARALEKAMQLPEGGDGAAWFFLAMAHWRLGHKELARKHYGKAVAWMHQYRPQDEELRRFRAEAESLLGIRNELKSGNKEN
jgi:serine/threonine protein kinase